MFVMSGGVFVARVFQIMFWAKVNVSERIPRWRAFAEHVALPLIGQRGSEEIVDDVEAEGIGESVEGSCQCEVGTRRHEACERRR